MLVFFIATGWYQTFHINRKKVVAERGSWIQRLRSVHVDQVYPTDNAKDFSPVLFKYLVALMSICLLITILLGMVLAFKSMKAKWQVWLCLLLGIAVPVITLWFGIK